MALTTFDPTQTPTASIGYQNIQNILINGGFEFWQRGTTFSSPATPATGAYTTDRWMMGYDGAPTFTVSREASVIDSVGTYALKVQITAVGGSTGFNIRQKLEDFSALRGKTLTFSARVRSNVAGVTLGLNDGVSPTYGSVAHTGGGAYETLTITKTFDSNASNFIAYIGFLTVAPAICTFYCDSAMLSFGSTAIPFVPTNSQVELAQCQRYYEKTYDLATPPGTATVTGYMRIVAGQINTTIMETGASFKVRKYAAPTMTFYRSDNGASGACVWRNTSAIESGRATVVGVSQPMAFSCSQSSAVEYLCYAHWTAESEL